MKIELPLPTPGVSSAGIVTLHQWTMMPNGETYMYLWAERWEIITDKMVPVDGFKSTEKWQIIGCAAGQPAVIIPGCQVKGWAFCAQPPARQNLYNVSTGKGLA